jgi:glycosyltransferase involved in cell wall biosynthesis
MGYRFGAELASLLAGADVFVFPSKTDTFGLVLLEAMACGLPVAAYPVDGPIDVVAHGRTGMLDDDLARACLQALELNPVHCRSDAQRHSWKRSTLEFASYLVDSTCDTARAQPASNSAR